MANELKFDGGVPSEREMFVNVLMNSIQTQIIVFFGIHLGSWMLRQIAAFQAEQKWGWIKRGGRATKW